MKILVSWSSGKDSAWMLHVLRQAGAGVGGLLTTVNEDADRVAMHGVRTSILRAQAAAARLPVVTVPLPHPCSNEIYEGRMAAAVRQAVADGFTHVAFGDLFLEDVRRYREERMAGTGLTPLFPLWLRPTGPLAEEMIDAGVEARVTCLDQRVLPTNLLAELPPGTDPCGERGEFHTCVLAGPMFAERIDALPGEIVERGDFVFADLYQAERAG
jgi:diphthamide synthase (EF-2-diphthine--ammonia ligase)